MQIENLIKEMEKDYELKNGFVQPEPGVWIIPVDQGIDIQIQRLTQGFLLKAKVGEVPKEKEEDLYHQMLMANLFGQGTRGAVLALEDEGGYLTLSRAIDYDINYKDFKDLVDDFINSVDFWHEEMLNYQSN
jgi:hypothetical protein